MPKCHVVIEGRPNDHPLGPTGTVGLVKDGSSVILIDVGDPWNGRELLQKLEMIHGAPATITHVVVTHGHLDHCANLGLFQEATIVMDWDLGKRSRVDQRKTEYRVIEGWPFRISDSCELMNLSGHTASDTIVIVRNKSKATVVYSGDLVEDSQDLQIFEKNQLKLLEFSDTSKSYENNLLISQEFIFGSGDVIVPGHGALFLNSDRIYFLFFGFWRRFM